MRPSLKVSTFYLRRFARIWPAHMVSLLLAIPVFYTLAADPSHSWVKTFSLPTYSKLVVVPLDVSSVAETGDKDLAGKVDSVLAVATSPFLEGLRKT